MEFARISSTVRFVDKNTPAAPTISGPVALDCSLYQLQLTGSHSSGATQYYTWSNGGFGQLDTIYSGGPYRLWYTDIYGCTSHADVSVPYSPESYFGWFPTGCYELCNGQLPLTMYGPPGIFAGWGWLYGGSYQSSGTHSVMAPLSVNAAGTYNMELNTGLCTKTTDDMNVSVKNCDNCPPLILNGTVVCDPTVPGGYTVNLNLNVTYPSTNCTIGTDIGPSVPFNAFFATPGAYGLMLNFTTLTMPPPATVTIMVRYSVKIGKQTKECYATITLTLPNCAGMWQDQKHILGTTNHAKVANGMLVYPNPAKHSVNVNYNYGSTTVIEGTRRIVVYDLTGKRVYTAPVAEMTGTIVIPVDGLAGATYILRMEEEGKAVQTQRLSVTH